MSQSHRIPIKGAFVAVASLLWIYPPLAPGLRADSTVDEQVKTIRTRYAAVDKDLSRCKQVKRDLMDESAEGGELTAYFLDQSLRKLVGKFYGETGQTREEYYFWGGRLFFVLRVESHYDKPLSGKVVRRSEQRFYFADDALIRWIDRKGKDDPTWPGMKKLGQDYLAQARKFSALVKK